MAAALSKYRDVVILGVCLGIPALVLYANSRPDAEAGPVAQAILAVTAPVQRLMSGAVSGVADRWETYSQDAQALEQARRLRVEMGRLARVAERVSELERENERLRALLNARPTPAAGRSTAARVVAVGASPVYRTVRIDVGREDGVRRGMAVVNADGAVGSVLRTTAGASDVMLISDRQSSVDVEVPRTGARGLLHGDGEVLSPLLRVDGLDRSDDVRPGDEVVASGLGARFPRGVRVGTVEAVEQPERGIYQVATVRPAARFRGLSNVLVILTAEEPVLPPPSAPGPEPAPDPSREAAKDAGAALEDLVEAPPAWVVVAAQDGGAPRPAERTPPELDGGTP